MGTPISTTDARKLALRILKDAERRRTEVDQEVDAAYDPPWPAMNQFALYWMMATHWQLGDDGQHYLLVDKDTAKTLLEWFQQVSANHG